MVQTFFSCQLDIERNWVVPEVPFGRIFKNNNVLQESCVTLLARKGFDSVCPLIGNIVILFLSLASKMRIIKHFYEGGIYLTIIGAGHFCTGSETIY